MAERKTFRIIRKDQEEEEDLLFWLERTPEERLDALQVMREQYRRLFHKGKGNRASARSWRTHQEGEGKANDR